MTKIWIRDWNDPNLIPPGSNDAISLVFVEYSFRQNGSRNVKVGGISVGAQQVVVGVANALGRITAPATVISATGHFEASLQIPSPNSVVPVVIDAANAGSNLVATDRASMVLQDALPVDLPSFIQFDFVPGRLDYAAGHVDRLHFSRNFVKLDPLPLFWQLLAGYYDSSGNIFVFNRGKMAKNIDPPALALQQKARSGKISLDEYYTKIEALLKNELYKSREAPVKNKLAAFKVIHRYYTSNRKDILSYSQGATFKKEFSTARKLLNGNVVLGLRDDPAEQLEQEIKKQIDFYNAHQRLGVLFYNRMRIRPTQLVAGEPIYQLALVPGEEVQIRQTTETKQKSSLTDIKDQDVERTTSLSSTWTTDLSSSLTTNTSFQQSSQVGGGVDGSVPEIPIGVSANASTSLAEAGGVGQESSVKESIQKTASTSAKMRTQHKIQIEITNEDATAFSSTRTLRNANQLRTLHHTFHKVYRKEQITLERYDAKLCVRLQLADPASFTRDGFLVGLNKIDPNNSGLYNVVKPTPKEDAVKPKPIDAPALHDTLARLDTIDRWVYLSGDLRKDAGSKARGNDLSSFEIVMTKMNVFFVKNQLHSTDGSEATDDVPVQRLTSPISNVKVHDLFGYYHGKIEWEQAIPDVEKQKTAYALKISLPVVFDGLPLPGSEIEYEIASVTFEIRTEWHPSDKTMQDYYRDIQDEKLRLTRELQPSMIYDLHAIANADYSSIVLHRALAEELDFPNGFDISHIKDIFDLDGVVIESVPYWAEPSAAENFLYLASRLKSLPINLEMNRILTDCLVASRAIIFLPVREGREQDALTLLKETRGHIDRIAVEFQQFRDSKFGPMPNLALPTIADLTDPPPTLATPAASTAWANDWEKPQRTFEVLGQWSEIVPTDGVHIETHLSNTSVADEQTRAKLMQITNGG